MSSRTGTLHTGMTNGLKRRVYQHKNKLIDGFTERYDVTRLVCFEEFRKVHDANVREKQIKGWLRRKKLALIESLNPEWRDLREGWWAGGMKGLCAAGAPLFGMGVHQDPTHSFRMTAGGGLRGVGRYRDWLFLCSGNGGLRRGAFRMTET